MSNQVDLCLRGTDAFTFARNALDDMEKWGVWPTPTAYEVWTHYICEPNGGLGVELSGLLKSGLTLTEIEFEALACKYLPKARLDVNVRDASLTLNQELNAALAAISAALKGQTAFGKTVESAKRRLDTNNPVELAGLLQELTTATRLAQSQNADIERRLAASTREVSRLRDHLEQVRREAQTDALTNLANRKVFDEELNRLDAPTLDRSQLLTIAMVDIDHFKRFNDTWGHQTGDQVIRYVASVLGRNAKPPRVAARYGGEEFGLIFPGETGAAVEAMINEMRVEIGSRMLKRRSTNEDLGAVTISAGVAERCANEDMMQLIDRVDQALYVSKRTGRNRVTNAERLRNASDAA